MQLGEQGERCGETHPAVEIPTVAAIAQREPDERDEPERREHRCGEDDARSLHGLERPVPSCLQLAQEERTAR